MLKDHLNLRSELAQRRVAEVGDVLALENDLTGVRLDEAQDAPPDGRLPRSAFADEAEGFPAAD
jgi:hypothetical protein